ncbi:MAG: hypothetical protein LBG64_03665 [Pseudomonadales bacterium]|jgi:glycerol-3-phosphate dehydrogenase (NAD(P)+)|nr:hypothetical protein [Pseudomonadales bacterium]
MRRVAVVGMGRFGYAMTYHLDRKNNSEVELYFYGHRADVAEYIDRNRVHPDFFGEYSLSPYVKITSNLIDVVQNSDVLVLALSSAALKGFLGEIKPHITKPLQIVHLIKALDKETGQRMSQIIKYELGSMPVTPAVLAGGTFDIDLLTGQFLGATLACENHLVLPQLRSIFDAPELNVDLSTDVIGCELAGAFKNVAAVFVGIINGLGYSYGSETHTLSRVTSEVEKLAADLGASTETFDMKSQCWGNDFVMCAMGSKSRNREFGVTLGRGHTYAQAVEAMVKEQKLVESVNTVAILPLLADLDEYPLLNFIYKLSLGQVRAHQLPGVITDNF